MIPYQWVSTALGIGAALLILWLIRRDHLHTRYALWWLPVALVIALLGVFPESVNPPALWLGIGYGPILPMLLGLLAIIVKLLLMDIERSRNERKLHRLIQRVALLEARLAKLEPGPETLGLESCQPPVVSDVDDDPR